jgi:hypothetical protein
MNRHRLALLARMGRTAPGSTFRRRAVMAALTAALAGCGAGSAPTDDTTETSGPATASPASTASTDPDRRQALSGFQVSPPASIKEQPADARVGLGQGTSFRVVAVPIGQARIIGYVWHHGRTTLKEKSSTLRLPAVTASSAGDYSVDVVTTLGTITSNLAQLTVVSRTWAALGGRPLVSAKALQQPSLGLCGAPTLAWIEPGASGRSVLRVSRFDGAAWQSIDGGGLNTTLTASASDPSLDCNPMGGTPTPVVAWTESLSTGGYTIRVRQPNNGQWVDTGPVPLTSGASSVKPTLRIAPLDGVRRPTGLPFGSALSWLDSTGQVKLAQWDNLRWVLRGSTYTHGDSLALTLDILSAPISGAPPDFLPLMAVVKDLPRQQTLIRAATWQYSGINPLGSPTSPIAPGLDQQRVVGIGFGSSSGGSGAYVVWRVGGPTYALQSSAFTGKSYLEDLHVIGPDLPWQPYAADLIGRDLQALSFDPTEWSTACIGSAPGFGLAVSDALGTRALVTDCWTSNTPEWISAAPQAVSTTPAQQLSLRMASRSDPVLATVMAAPTTTGASMVELSVWRYVP